MDELTLQFFDAHPGALPLYEAFETRVTDLVPDVRIKVQKTQISFYNRHLFACVSFARIRKKKNCPDNCHIWSGTQGGVSKDRHCHRAVSESLDTSRADYGSCGD